MHPLLEQLIEKYDLPSDVAQARKQEELPKIHEAINRAMELGKE